MLNVASEEQTGKEQLFWGDFCKFKSGVKKTKRFHKFIFSVQILFMMHKNLIFQPH